MLIIFEKILTIFLMIALGFVATRAKWVKPEMQFHLSKFLVMFALPCMILSSITSHQLTDETTGVTLKILLVGVIFYLFCAISGFLLSKYVFKTGEDLGVYMFSFSTNNTGFMGFPIVLAIYGQEYFFYIAIFNIVMSTYCNSIGPIVVNIGAEDKGKMDFKYIVKSFFSPITVCIILSLVMLFTRLHFPEVIFSPISTIGDTVVPISLFVVGMQLASSSVKKIVKNKALVWLSFIKMTVLPVLLFFLVNQFDIPNAAKACIVLGGALPTAAIAPAIANIEKRNGLVPAEMVVFTTIIALVEVPFMIRFFQTFYGV